MPQHLQITTPVEVRIPTWLWFAVLVSTLSGGVAGYFSGSGPGGYRISHAVFLGAAAGYLAISLLDFWEHLRLERESTGHYFAMTAIPFGETVNHAATVSAILALVWLARPIASDQLELADVYVLIAPALILALGWRDEIVYHRRRARHREDIMHTTAHLAMGAMLAGLYASRLVSWAPSR